MLSHRQEAHLRKKIKIKKEHPGKGRKGQLGEVSVKLQHMIKIHKDFSEEASIVGNYWWATV